MLTTNPDTQSRSRRALLAGALGGLGAWALTAIGRASPVEAAAGDAIRMGGLNSAGGTSTSLRTTTNSSAFLVEQLGHGPALRAEATIGSGVEGKAVDGVGVIGRSRNEAGVTGESFRSTGVLGISHRLGTSAVVGQSDRGKGVEGRTKSGWAVSGSSPDGIGVFGGSTNRAGVVGVSENAPGVRGFSRNGYAGKSEGSLRVTDYTDIDEIGVPGPPRRNMARLFARDDGAGKTQLCVRFNTGAVQVIATEP